MKKLTILGGALLLVLAMVSCNKERTCRCAVPGNNYERVIKIEGGTCEQLRYVLYDEHRIIAADRTDSILCTDYFSDNNNN